jgi:cytidylate kinase
MTEEEAPVVAIDGPSGTGKGTLCLRLARHLGWHFLDSGALYRIVGWQALRQGSDLSDTSTLTAIARDLRIDFDCSDDRNPEVTVRVAGENISDAIRTEDSARAASVVAAIPEVRAALLDRQRAFRCRPGLIADGRDMGTVVFPDADLKIYLSASAEERARRRYNQLKENGIDVNLPQLLKGIAERDARDSERAAAPLRPAHDALVVDTTDIDKDTVFERVLRLIIERLK